MTNKQPAQPERAPDEWLEDDPPKPDVNDLDLRFPNPDGWTLEDAELVEQHSGRRFNDLTARDSDPPNMLETRVMIWVENRKHHPDHSLDDYKALTMERLGVLVAPILAAMKADDDDADELVVQRDDNRVVDDDPLGTGG